jgi:hypothetical protein
MMQLGKTVSRGLWALALIAILQSCLGTEAKKLGNKSSTGTGDIDSDTDSFAVTLAYRADEITDDTRVVVLQGERDNDAAALSHVCGTTGASCYCEFYQANRTIAPVISVSATHGLSTANNSFSCSIPGAVDPDLYTDVILKSSDGTKSTGFIAIDSDGLELTDILGDLSTSKINKISSYSCSRTFFEGEGVNGNTVTCAASQKLGLITANYIYYMYTNVGGAGSTTSSGVAVYPAVCNRNGFVQYACQSDGQATLRYGLYSESAVPFVRPVSMYAGPNAANAAVFGYAAEPDSRGNCPTGLVKVQVYKATPQSIIQGSLPGGTNPPSNFVNTGGVLNSSVLESAAPAAMSILRQANQTACAAAPVLPTDPAVGDCTSATFQGVYQVTTAAYVAGSPQVCVIPGSLVQGL